MEHKLSVGQTIYLKPIGNAARYHKDPIPTKITKIGKKYFEVDERTRDRFHIDTLLQDGKGYSPDYQGYLSLQEIEDEKEYYKLIECIRTTFDRWRGYGKSITLDQLRRIVAIIDEEQQDVV